MAMEFRDKFIAFVDLLGFKEMIKAAEAGTGRSLSEIDQLWSELSRNGAQESIKKYGSHICPESSFLQNDLDFKVTQISDCVILSAEPSPAGVINIVNHCWNAAINLLPKGVMVRGYVTRGKIYHDGLKIAGTGYIKAYQQETAVAAFKRTATEEGTPYIEIDPEVCEYVSKQTDDCVRKMFGRYVKSDGQTTAIFPFQVLAHSFGLGVGFPPLDGEKEKAHNNNIRRLLGDFKRQVLLNVEGSAAKAQQKAEHYASALDDQLKVCDNTDHIIDTLMGKR